MKISRFVLGAALAAVSLGGASASETSFEKAKIVAGEMLYKAECRRCHAPDADHASYGPRLENVIGRVAGSVPDYDYSETLKRSGLVWTEAALRAWMEDNTGFLPGTKMRHVGIADPTVQDFILAYLHSISASD